MIEYGYDINDMKAFTDETLSVEIPIESISKDALEKILGGTVITRCKDCKYWDSEITQTAVPNMRSCIYWGKIGTLGIDYCSRAKRKEE